MNLQSLGKVSMTAVHRFLYWIGRTTCYIVGLLGINAVFQILLIIFYDLSYDYMIFFHLTHVQSTTTRFILAGTATTLILRFAIKLKRIIWWIWGTQTPDYEPNLNSQSPADESLVETARRKGFQYFWFGLTIAYLVALTGFYQVAFAESTFTTGFPEIPVLHDIIDYLARFPLINNLVGLTEILPAQNAISYIVIACVLMPLTLGLYNISYVLEHNRFIREDARSNPSQTETIYFAVIPFGVLFLIFLIWVFLTV